MTMFCRHFRQHHSFTNPGRKKIKVGDDGDGTASEGKSTDVPPTAPSAPSAPSAAPSSPRSMTTEEICRLPTLALGDDVAPTLPETLPETPSMVRQDSVLAHGASFHDESKEAQICEAHRSMGWGGVVGIQGST